MNGKFQNRYRIESNRAQWWDYDRNWAYFVTICTKNRKHDFGLIRSGEIFFTEIGKIAHKYWHEIPNHFPYVSLDAFVVMPNHVHGIVIINNPVVETLHATSVQKKGHASDSVETLHATSVQKKMEHANDPQKGISPKKGSLAAIIRSYKSAVTRQAHQLESNFAWQTRFHDHIIRNKDEWFRICHYINTNIQNWEGDKFDSI